MSEIHTPRLVLRPYVLSDEPRMCALLTDARVTQTYMIPPLPTPREQSAMFRRLLDLSEDEARFERAIALCGKVIGFMNDVEICGGMIELGYVIHPDHQGHGYASEALAAAIEHLFGLGYTEIRAGAFMENAASFRVMQKCGMRPLPGTEEIEYRGKRFTCAYYHIVSRGTQKTDA